MYMLIRSLVVMLSFLSFTVSAQVPGGRPGGQNMNMGRFYGKVVDASGKDGIEAASVQIIQNKMDTATRQRRDFILATVLTDRKGDFSIENLPVMGNFRIRISAIGHKQLEQKVAFDLGGARGDMSAMMSAVDKDLGNIKLEQDSKELQNVTVAASRPLLQMNLDKKVYNVEKDLSAAGGTAVDVMKNVPSVNVDIDGNVTLRNSSPQIFLDGRPTTLTLDQIPADQIASVEIMTNPSAKYDASGGGSGILNIVLKKNRRVGYNGNVRASLDSRGRPGGGGDVNVRQGKVNFFVAGMIGMPKSLGTSFTNRTDFFSDRTTHFVQNGEPSFQGTFGFVRAGIDYFIDNRNTLTFSGNLNRRKFETEDFLNIYRDTVFNAGGMVSESGIRGTESDSRGKNLGGSLSFKHNFARAGKEWTADVNYHTMDNNNQSTFNSQYFLADNTPKGAMAWERSRSITDSRFMTLQTDYVDPVTKTSKIEAGLRMSRREFNSLNQNYIRNSAGEYINIPGFNIEYNFVDIVYAGYATWSKQVGKFSYQLGLRAESSENSGDLVSKNQQFSTEYPLSLFPTAFFSYKLTDKQDIQLNYSRKVNRPNFWQLIPFIDYSDSLNLSVGNPQLVPEFTHLVELGYANQYKPGNSLFVNVYGRYTEDLIARYQYRDANPDPAKSDSVLFTSYANANKSYTYGLELTARNRVTKFWDLNTNVNVFNSTIEAGNLTGGSSNDQWSWFGKVSNSFKLPKKFSVQLNADYQAKTLVPAGGGGRGGWMGGGNQATAQGYIKPVYGADLSIRKDFGRNNAATLTLQFSDIFRTRLYESHSESVFFVQDNSRRRDPQVLRLNFNYRFGKFDASLFKRRNMRSGGDNDMQNMPM